MIAAIFLGLYSAFALRILSQRMQRKAIRVERKYEAELRAIEALRRRRR
jgi:hypothetical protein